MGEERGWSGSHAPGSKRVAATLLHEWLQQRDAVLRCEKVEEERDAEYGHREDLQQVLNSAAEMRPLKSAAPRCSTSSSVFTSEPASTLGSAAKAALSDGARAAEERRSHPPPKHCSGFGRSGLGGTTRLELVAVLCAGKCELELRSKRARSASHLYWTPSLGSHRSHGRCARAADDRG